MSAPAPVFFFDLTEPECYLAAEQVVAVLGAARVEWEPVSAERLGCARGSVGAVGGVGPAGGVDVPRLAERARELGLQQLRWPAGWPPDGERPALAATYAKNIGRLVSFSLAAMRQAFAGGRDLGDDSTLLLAGAACEIHPNALLRGIELRSVAGALERACARAGELGVCELPAIVWADRVWPGPGAVQAVAATLEAGAAGVPGPS